MAKKTTPRQPAATAVPAELPGNGLLLAPARQLLPATAGLSTTPTLLFYSDFTQAVCGDLDPLLPSPKLRIGYSAARLPGAVATSPAWQATAYVSYGNGQPPLPLPLYPAGEAPFTSGGNAGSIGFGQAQMLTTYNDNPLPADAQDLAVWFRFELSDGQVFWDSNYGQNYHFGFANDVQVTSAYVAGPEPSAPYAGLGITVNAGADVSAVTVNYTVLNASNIPMQGQVAMSPSDSTQQGVCQWQVSEILMRAYAIVYFTISYEARGNSYLNDNNGQGYLVS